MDVWSSDPRLAPTDPVFEASTAGNRLSTRALLWSGCSGGEFDPWSERPRLGSPAFPTRSPAHLMNEVG